MSIKSKPGVNGPKEKEIPCNVQDNGNNTFTVNYAPEAPGDYNVAVKFGGKEIPKSPIPVKVIPDVDVSKIKVKNLEPSKLEDFIAELGLCGRLSQYSYDFVDVECYHSGASTFFFVGGSHSRATILMWKAFILELGSFFDGGGSIEGLVPLCCWGQSVSS